jgi:hypothetical protein
VIFLFTIHLEFVSFFIMQVSSEQDKLEFIAQAENTMPTEVVPSLHGTTRAVLC